MPIWSVRVAVAVALFGVAGTLIQFGPSFAWFSMAAFAGLLVLSVALAVPMVM